MNNNFEIIDCKISTLSMVLYDEEVKCDCGGDIIYTNIVVKTYPDYYLYRCNKCGKKVVLPTDDINLY